MSEDLHPISVMGFYPRISRKQSYARAFFVGEDAIAVVLLLENPSFSVERLAHKGCQHGLHPNWNCIFQFGFWSAQLFFETFIGMPNRSGPCPFFRRSPRYFAARIEGRSFFPIATFVPGNFGQQTLAAAGPIMAGLAWEEQWAELLARLSWQVFPSSKREGRLKKGGILLSVHCDTSDEIKRAKQVMEATCAEDVSSTGESSTNVAKAGH
jgi:hypothetical protein